MSQQSADLQKGIPRPPWLRALILLSLLFLFMASVNMMGAGFALMEDVSTAMLSSVTKSPLAALMVGVLATAIVQSSSVTTSIIVGLVATGQLDVQGAVPMVMGANIGTTITCALVSMGYVSRRGRFQRAFSASSMHDFFNFATVGILLPLELSTRLLSRTARRLTESFTSVTHFDSPGSPIKALTGLPAKLFERFLTDLLGLGDRVAAILMVVLALALLFVSLYLLTRTLKSLLSGKMANIFDQFLFKTPLAALTVGFLVTVAVQSSSVTTSLMVPLVASGVLSHSQAFPYTMGAHVGTTVTALIAALGAGATDGLTIALVHTLYNLAGVAIFFPFRSIRNIPVSLARRLGALTLRSRWLALLYVVTVFFLVPALVILLAR